MAANNKTLLKVAFIWGCVVSVFAFILILPPILTYFIYKGYKAGSIKNHKILIGILSLIFLAIVPGILVLISD